MEPRDRFWRTIAALALLLCAILIGERYLRGYFLAETAPRQVAPRADFVGEEARTTALFAKTAPSVVAIYARGGGGRTGDGGLGTGSGFVWDRAGHIVTNHHVVAQATQIGVVLSGEDPVPARLVGTAPWVDLAVLKLSDPPDDLRPIPIGTSADLAVGQSVYAIGNPFGLSRSLTTGVISALDRRFPTESGREVVGVIQTDTAINPGNSGGPLVDSSGRLIGVNSAILAPTGSFTGVGFAIPVDTVNRIVPELIRDGRARLPGIGFVPLPEEVAHQHGIRGIVVQSVPVGSTAAQAGLRGMDDSGRLGDVIVAAEDKPVATVADLGAVLERIGIGNKARLTVVRNGVRRELSAPVLDVSPRANSRP
ncbi:MAG TPA: trypsin-like peptidase domain-containing protein [Hyphomicrobiaceae bacterium]|nr:trypsin-like peptidase domain-containing protein [Hyphomicrobiaceae bacterium]